MVGIYKYKNKINGKIYIGQSNDIERRYKEHLYKKGLAIEQAIDKYGIENFTFEILEICLKEELDEKEKYYIKLFKSYENGYNCNEGGGDSSGGNNGRSKLTEEDVKEIRIAYNQHKRRKEIYQRYKDKIAFTTFERVWDGSQWSHIMPEVYTEENKLYYMKQATNGELSENSIFTDAEVIKMRERYVQETAKQIYEDVKDRCSYQTLQQILWGRRYKHLPIYKKKTKEWINR